MPETIWKLNLKSISTIVPFFAKNVSNVSDLSVIRVAEG